ncbi:hypothetical protein B0H17DRAFT_1127653 [Mycena rosella]|uniref:Uncharacterized protein n=1 Tax=Mycena rosella TaxID=1033263 RepID=A0AAD7E150_MYCRO|nr:hypothetical protein B0H17DRAFT_1127653 [Mycena rosella]
MIALKIRQKMHHEQPSIPRRVPIPIRCHSLYPTFNLIPLRGGAMGGHIIKSHHAGSSSCAHVGHGVSGIRFLMADERVIGVGLGGGVTKRTKRSSRVGGCATVARWLARGGRRSSGSSGIGTSGRMSELRLRCGGLLRWSTESLRMRIRPLGASEDEPTVRVSVRVSAGLPVILDVRPRRVGCTFGRDASSNIEGTYPSARRASNRDFRLFSGGGAALGGTYEELDVDESADSMDFVCGKGVRGKWTSTTTMSAFGALQRERRVENVFFMRLGVEKDMEQ